MTEIKHDFRMAFSADCELIALGYFLHRRGLLATGAIDEIDEILDRQPGAVDVHAYSFKLMLGLGCERITVFDGPLVTEPEPYGSWLEAVTRRSPESVRQVNEAQLQALHAAACVSMQAISEVYQRHRESFIHQHRPVSQADIDTMLADERHIFTVQTCDADNIVGAVSGTIAPRRYRAYEMFRGEFEADPDIFRSHNGLALLGWRLP